MIINEAEWYIEFLLVWIFKIALKIKDIEKSSCD
jgi:hypothetical protein